VGLDSRVGPPLGVASGDELGLDDGLEDGVADGASDGVGVGVGETGWWLSDVADGEGSGDRVVGDVPVVAGAVVAS
jgi:hypothetical protein